MNESSIPTLNQTLDDKDVLRGRNIFYLWFFNFEMRIQELSSFGYIVKRFLYQESTGQRLVMYKFPAVGYLNEATFKFKSEEAADTRLQIENHFRELDRVFEEERAIRNAKSVISTLTPDQISALKSVDPIDLTKLLK